MPPQVSNVKRPTAKGADADSGQVDGRHREHLGRGPHDLRPDREHAHPDGVSFETSWSTTRALPASTSSSSGGLELIVIAFGGVE